jgi:transportin-1
MASAAGWIPDAGVMQQTVQLIHLMNTSTTTEMQRQVMVELDRQSAVPEFPRYLAVIFGKSDANADLGLRLHAGMTMKNVLFNRIGEYRRGGPPPLDPETLAICHKSLLTALMDEQHTLRQTAGTAISQLVARGGLARWPDLLPNLTQALEQDLSNVNMLCGVMDTFSKLTEDIPFLMIRETPQLLEVLVPKWISLFAHENSLVRNCAAMCVNTFIPFDPAPLVIHVNQFLEVRKSF